MKPALFSIEQAPRTLPIWDTILEDLNRPPARRVARVLGVGASTVYRWNQTGRPPRMACLALFWLTRWGRSEIHTRDTNDAIFYAGYVGTLRRQVAELEARTDRLARLGNFGSANDPTARIGT